MPPYLIDENLPDFLVDAAQDQGEGARWVRDIMPGADRAYESVCEGGGGGLEREHREGSERQTLRKS